MNKLPVSIQDAQLNKNLCKQTKTIQPSSPSKLDKALATRLPVLLLLWSTCWLLTGCHMPAGSLTSEPVIPLSQPYNQACKVSSHDLSKQSSEETFKQFFLERRAKVIWDYLCFYFGDDRLPQDVNMINDACMYSKKGVNDLLDKYNTTGQASLRKAIALYIAIKQQEAAFRDFLQLNAVSEVWDRLRRVRFNRQDTLDLRFMLQTATPAVQSHVLKGVVQFILNYCPKLVVLNLSANGLTTLPDTFGKLINLNALYLEANKLTTLPDSFGELTQLQRLELDANQLTALPNTFGKLNKLNRLNLNHNQLTALPDTFGNLTQLERLYLEANHLTQLPDTFRELIKLHTLDLSNNWLTTLPDWLTKRTNLDDLKLINNPIDGPVEYISFRYLLKRNRLDEIWDRLQRAKINQEPILDLSMKLHRCAPEVQFHVLQGVFHFIQYHLPALVQLHLRENLLTQLPDTFGNLINLHTLDLSYNQLTAFPDTFGNLTQLERLYLEANHLTQLPDTFRDLINLHTLVLSFNWLNQLSDIFEKLTQLQRLELQYNYLTELPDSFRNLINLKILNLNHNQLTTLPGSIQKLTKLEDFELAGNPLPQLSGDIDQIGEELTMSNVNRLFFPSLTERAALIARGQISYNHTTGRPNLPQDCINAIEDPNTYPVILVLSQLGDVRLDRPVPLYLNLTSQEIVDHVYANHSLIVTNQGIIRRANRQ